MAQGVARRPRYDLELFQTEATLERLGPRQEHEGVNRNQEWARPARREGPELQHVAPGHPNVDRWRR